MGSPLLGKTNFPIGFRTEANIHHIIAFSLLRRAMGSGRIKLTWEQSLQVYKNLMAAVKYGK